MGISYNILIMSNSLEITNIGKIKKAKVKLDGLSVFVGTNNTGKSYVSRVLYSILSAAKINPQERYQNIANDEFYRIVRRANAKLSRGLFKGKDRGDAGRIRFELDFPLRAMTRNSKSRTQDSSDYDLPDIEEIKQRAGTVLRNFDKREKELDLSSHKKTLNTYYKELDEIFAELKKELKKSKDYEHVIGKIYSERFKDSLLHNFQATHLTDLLGDKSQDASIKLSFLNDDHVDLRISKQGEIKDLTVDITEPELYSSVVYLESPIYWKIKNELEEKIKDEFYWKIKDELEGRSLIGEDGRELLQGVPRYMQSLIRKVDDSMNAIQRSEDREFSEELSKEISEIIGGKIIMDKNNKQLMFSEKEAGSQEPISLHLTATGISQLGMLGFLIEWQIIRKGSVVFIDELEAHLHPAWQEKITEVVYKMHENGIRCIVATHSPVIIQRLELFESDRNKETTEEISLNFFDPNGEFDSTNESWTEVNKKAAKSLEQPAYQMYIQSMFTQAKK